MRLRQKRHRRRKREKTIGGSARRLRSDGIRKEHFRDRLLSRLPHPEKVDIKDEWFPETAYAIEDEKYAFVHIDTGLYQPTYSGIQYFFPRLNRGGVILVSGYTDGKTQSVYRAVRDLEEKYGVLLIIPLSDEKGSIVIVKP